MAEPPRLLSLCSQTQDYASWLAFSYSSSLLLFFSSSFFVLVLGLVLFWGGIKKKTRSSRGGGKRGNLAALARFPSGVGKSRFWTFPRSAVFHGPFTPKF